MPYGAGVSRRLGSGEGDPPAVGRWEVVTEDDDESFPEDELEFDTFVVHIREPPHYHLTGELLQQLVDRGSFHIEDGREDTHGG